MFTIKEIERQARVKLLDTYEDNYRFNPQRPPRIEVR